MLLAIASKNNEEDAMEILEHHPHMLLGPEDFAARRINWDPKPDNIRKMAEELNLGTDSFVFFDDSEAERGDCARFPGKPGGTGALHGKDL